jgi:hypothetical protein
MRLRQRASANARVTVVRSTPSRCARSVGGGKRSPAASAHWRARQPTRRRCADAGRRPFQVGKPFAVFVRPEAHACSRICWHTIYHIVCIHWNNNILTRGGSAQRYCQGTKDHAVCRGTSALAPAGTHRNSWAAPGSRFAAFFQRFPQLAPGRVQGSDPALQPHPAAREVCATSISFAARTNIMPRPSIWISSCAALRGRTSQRVSDLRRRPPRFFVTQPALPRAA